MGNMRFTEEEFYGNTQNTVLEGGEIVPTNVNVVESKKEKQSANNLAFDIFSTFGKTLAILVGVLFYVMSITICLAPRTAIRVLDFVGAEKVSLVCYERIYEKEKTLASLYNLVQKSIQNKNHKKTAKYIEELQGKSDYVNFCIKVNSATLKATEKEYVAFVGDLDSYLVSQNIIAEYKSNKKGEAKTIALLDLTNSNVYSFGFSSYIECLEDDNQLTQQEINALLLELVNQNLENKTILDLIKQRRQIVDVSLSDGTTNDKILRVYTSLKIEKVLYKIYLIQGEEELKAQVTQNIQDLQNEYNNLIR